MFDVFTGPMLELFATSLWETIVMVGISGLIGALVGMPLGVYLHLTDAGGVLQNRPGQPHRRRHRQRGALHAFHHPAGGDHSAHALAHRLARSAPRRPWCR